MDDDEAGVRLWGVGRVVGMESDQVVVVGAHVMIISAGDKRG